jgi:hypothetical protein
VVIPNARKYSSSTRQSIQGLQIGLVDIVLDADFTLSAYLAGGDPSLAAHPLSS